MNWFKDPGNFWNFRAIFHPRGLDYVPDRGGFNDGAKTPERAAFLKSVLDSEEFAKWVREQLPASSETYSADDGVFHLRATNNASYGYTYLWAWEGSDAARAHKAS